MSFFVIMGVYGGKRAFREIQSRCVVETGATGDGGAAKPRL